MTAVTIVANDISASQDRGAWIDVTLTAAVALVIGNLVYIDANNQLNKAIADSAAHARVYGMVVGYPDGTNYGETTVPAGGIPAVCVAGNVMVGPGCLIGSTPLENGQLLYLSKTVAGGLDDTAPTGAFQVIVARAEGAQQIYIMPGLSAPVSA
jgi:hypothetical protein